jgi:hypothetical protein
MMISTAGVSSCTMSEKSKPVGAGVRDETMLLVAIFDPQ